MRYLVEITQSPTIPVTVDAESDQEAIEQVLLQRGEVGDTFYGEPTFTVKKLDDS